MNRFIRILGSDVVLDIEKIFAINCSETKLIIAFSEKNECPCVLEYLFEQKSQEALTDTTNKINDYYRNLS